MYYGIVKTVNTFIKIQTLDGLSLVLFTTAVCDEWFERKRMHNEDKIIDSL